MNDVYVVERDYDCECSVLEGAYADLETALRLADSIDYGDRVSVTRCAPEPVDGYVRDGGAPEDLPDTLTYRRFLVGQTCDETIERPNPRKVAR